MRVLNGQDLQSAPKRGTNSLYPCPKRRGPFFCALISLKGNGMPPGRRAPHPILGGRWGTYLAPVAISLGRGRRATASPGTSRGIWA